MVEFVHRVYRCEWQICELTLDQYGKTMRSYSLKSFPSHEEARAHLEEYAEPHKFIAGRWMPIGRKHEYCEIEIHYKEILVKEIGHEL